MAYKRFTSSTDQLRPDPRYKSKLLAKFINVMMYDGKKSTTQRMMYKALEIAEKRVEDATAIEIFEKAVENVKPRLEVRSKRVGGANYQVPMPVSGKRQLSLAMRWMRDAIRSGSGRPTHERAAAEIVAAYNGEGAAVTTRENVHRMADANKAFAHFAWGR